MKIRKLRNLLLIEHWQQIKSYSKNLDKENVKCFVNIFGGSIVAMNSGYENITINDNNNELVDIYKAFITRHQLKFIIIFIKLLSKPNLEQKKILKNLKIKLPNPKEIHSIYFYLKSSVDILHFI